MDQAQPVCTAHDPSQLLFDLRVVVAGQDPHDRRHGPCVSRPVMWSAYGADDGSVHEVRVLRAGDEGSGGLVCWVGAGEKAGEGCREERGNVGVVHEVVGGEAVGFVGEDRGAVAEGGGADGGDRFTQGG